MPGPTSQFKRGQIIALRDSGMGTRDISAHLNISVSTDRVKNDSSKKHRQFKIQFVIYSLCVFYCRNVRSLA